jgi:cytoskeletal protein CcmA (bactofilin family)
LLENFLILPMRSFSQSRIANQNSREVFMALWNQPTPVESNEKPNGTTVMTPPPPAPASVATPQPAPTPPPKETAPVQRRESVFGPDVSIEGKIEGDTAVRISGKFKGDIQIKGDLNIEKGAHIAAQVHAANISIGGELDGNVVATGQVKLLESGQLIGDLKATSFTVASGSRMRGHVEFGFGGAEVVKFVNGGVHEKDKTSKAE